MSGKATAHFKWQRITAIVNIPLAVFFLAVLISHIGSDYMTVIDSLSRPPMALALLAFVLCALWHACLGMQVVVDDYIRHPVMRRLALVINNLFSFAVGLVCCLAILKLVMC